MVESTVHVTFIRKIGGISVLCHKKKSARRVTSVQASRYQLEKDPVLWSPIERDPEVGDAGRARGQGEAGHLGRRREGRRTSSRSVSPRADGQQILVD